MEGDYPKFAREVGTGRSRRKSDKQIWEDFRQAAKDINEEYQLNPYGLIPGLLYHERVPRGHAWMGASTKWGNSLLEELKERRAAEVAGAGKRLGPALEEGSRSTQEQFWNIAYEWMHDDIVIQFDDVGNEVYVHSRWGVLRDDIGKPRKAVEHDKRSGARYWPIGRV